MSDTDTHAPERGRGARPLGGRPMADAERSHRYRRRHSATRLLRLPAETADRLTAEADRLGVEPGAVLAEALAALETTGRVGA